MAGVFFAYCGVVVRMIFAIRQPAALKLGKPLLCILASSIVARVGPFSRKGSNHHTPSCSEDLNVSIGNGLIGRSMGERMSHQLWPWFLPEAMPCMCKAGTS
jgi:hypothetical protein